MERNLDKKKLEPILKQNGFTQTTANTWVTFIDNKRYLVDFKNKHICRTQGENLTERIHEDPDDKTLNAIIKMCMDAMGGEQSSSEAPEADQSKEAEKEEESTNDDNVAEPDERIGKTVYCNECGKEIPSTDAVVPDEDAVFCKPCYTKLTSANNSVKSSKILDLIEKYAGSDVIELFGDTGTGKSKLALHVAQEAIRAGKKVYYLDTERNLTKDDLLSIKGATYKYTPDLEEIKSIVAKLPKCDVVVIDSIGFPILTEFATMSLKERGDALLDMIAIFGSLKKWCYHNNGFAFVTNQPESEFNKDKNHVLRPFGDKSQFAAKEIWKTEFIQRAPTVTKSKVIAFRSRSVGQRTQIAVLEITGNGVEVKA